MRGGENMTVEKWTIFGILSLLLFTSIVFAESSDGSLSTAGSQAEPANRTALVLGYPDGEKSTISMRGTFLCPQANGEAEINRYDQRTEIRLEIANLFFPKNLGDFYTTYVLWAITPDGKIDRLADVAISSNFKIEAMTPHQAFGLIITAEPHPEVGLPSPVILAENQHHRKTSSAVRTLRAKYHGDDGFLYLAPLPKSESDTADDQTPTLVLGARRAVEIARRAGAQQYAEAELQRVESKLKELELSWPQQRQNEKQYAGLARDIMRLAEQARLLAKERAPKRQKNNERSESEMVIRENTDAASPIQPRLHLPGTSSLSRLSYLSLFHSSAHPLPARHR
jgi:hypothetical protein